jgi:uncharacterized metal-binding protein YceD (DUF177 family)
MTAAEFSRPVRIDGIGEPRAMAIAAEPEERAALARRFGLLALDRLEAELMLSRSGDEISLHGTLQASVVQACAATAVPVPAELAVPFDVFFRPLVETRSEEEEEIELSESEMDVVFYEKAEIDVGEAVAETLLLNLDPYPRAPDAEEILKAAGVKGEGEEEIGPFAALAALKDRLKGTD